MAQILDSLCQVAEEENVVFADLTCDLNIGAIASTDDESTIQYKLHMES